MVCRYLLLAISLFCCVAASTFANLRWLMSEDGDDHPSDIKFSHKMHIKDIGVECKACHPAAVKSNLSSDNLGSTHDQCRGCHEDLLTNDCGFCHEKPENIKRRSGIDRELIFSHKIHLEMKNVGCTTCHLGLEEIHLSTAKNFPSMASCIVCHSDQNASTECETCHTAVDRLK